MGWLREVESFPGMYGSPWSGNGKPVIGASVRAHVCKILPKKMALEHFPGDDGTAILEGVVMDNTDARGLSIEWKLPNDSVFRRNNAQRISDIFYNEVYSILFRPGVMAHQDEY